LSDANKSKAAGKGMSFSQREARRAIRITTELDRMAKIEVAKGLMTG
jgi:hypothetical protein